jgi:predicted Zn-ribbon and HTH transcriptional regulator
MKEQIQKLRSKNGVIYPNTVKKLSSDFISDVKLENPKLKSDNIYEHFYWILNDLHDYPKVCKKCGKSITAFRSINEGYKADFCSISCQRSWHLEKTPKVEKPKKTKEEIIKRKIENSRLKYGTDFPCQSEVVKSKIKQTFIKHYGVDNPFASPDVKQKIKDTVKTNYGVENVSQAKEIREKIEMKSLEKFGSPSFLGSHDNRERLKQLAFEKILKCVGKRGYTLVSEKWSKCSDSYKWRHECGHEFVDDVNNGSYPRCPKCFPKTCSNDQQIIVDFIKANYDGEIIVNDRKAIAPLELDIYLPEKAFAIEYHGLYWHSTDLTPTKEFKNYHLNKYAKCSEKGIRLFQIFSDELRDQNEILKSRILNAIGKSTKVFARKCKIVELSNNEKSDFLDENHLQGDVNSSIQLGLMYQDTLVSVMTFGKSRFSRSFEYELLRFANKLGVTVIGGASKLLTFFEKKYQPKSMITYADLRFSNGNLYRKLGFNFDHQSSPNYYYFKNEEHVRYSRMKFQKHKLKGVLTTFDESKSEMENMLDNDYRVIFDCGNLVFTKSFC